MFRPVVAIIRFHHSTHLITHRIILNESNNNFNSLTKKCGKYSLQHIYVFK